MKDFRSVHLSGIILTQPRHGVTPEREQALVFQINAEIEFGTQQFTCYARINEYSERDLQAGRWVDFEGRLGTSNCIRIDFYRAMDIPGRQERPRQRNDHWTEGPDPTDYIPPSKDEPEPGNRRERSEAQHGIQRQTVYEPNDDSFDETNRVQVPAPPTTVRSRVGRFFNRGKL